MPLGTIGRNTEIQKYICHQAFTQSIQSTSRGTSHTSTRTVQDSPPPQRRSALRTIVIIVIILCTHAQQGHQTSGSCSQHIHQGAGAQHGAAFALPVGHRPPPPSSRLRHLVQLAEPPWGHHTLPSARLRRHFRWDWARLAGSAAATP